jgi:N-methylhydantoinase A/oxoprolinase/acetone carboxylase beta subunit
VVGTFREFERAATTEVDAGLSPLLARYLRRLLDASRHAGLPTPAIMQSSGGLAALETAADHAALTVLSGPAGGAAAAALLAERCGEPDLLCFDMGGTSCDVCVVEGGRVRETTAREVGGRPLALPMVDIHTVGAGGGSIGWRDPGGALRVGPRSAGAEPGPACYGRGGTEPTVTDANLVLGHLSADVALAGDVALDAGAADAAVERLAAELGLDVRACAEGIVRVANAEMVRALRVMTVERGIDPRRFALLAFGGAGPLHAAAIAEELGMTKILVPRASGVLSALGLAAADRRADAQRTVLGSDDAGVEALRDEVAAALGGEPEIEVAWDLRYHGQSHELTVRGAEREELRERFEALHEERYGHRDPDGDVELVTVRVTGRLPAAPVDFGAPAGEEVAGPSVVALPEATLVVPEGWSGSTDDTGTLVLERAP